MSQTPQQIRLGGFVALGVAALTAIIFGLIALVTHNGHFILAALGPTLISAIMGIVYVVQAEPMAKVIATRAANKPTPPPTQVQSLRSMGQIFLAVGAFLVVGFVIVAIVAHNPFFFLAAFAPGIIFCTMGLLYIITSPKSLS